MEQNAASAELSIYLSIYINSPGCQSLFYVLLGQSAKSSYYVVVWCENIEHMKEGTNNSAGATVHRTHCSAAGPSASVRGPSTQLRSMSMPAKPAGEWRQRPLL